MGETQKYKGKKYWLYTCCTGGADLVGEKCGDYKGGNWWIIVLVLIAVICCCCCVCGVVALWCRVIAGGGRQSQGPTNPPVVHSQDPQPMQVQQNTGYNPQGYNPQGYNPQPYGQQQYEIDEKDSPSNRLRIA